MSDTVRIEDKWGDLRALAEAATPGPWLRTAEGTAVMTGYRDERGTMIPSNWKRGGHPVLISRKASFDDAAYIAAAHPAAIIGLLDENDRLRAALIESGRNVGAILKETVSTDFLMDVPGEVRLVVAHLRQDHDLTKRLFHEERQKCSDMEIRACRAETALAALTSDLAAGEPVDSGDVEHLESTQLRAELAEARRALASIAMEMSARWESGRDVWWLNWKANHAAAIHAAAIARPQEAGQ